MLTDLKLSIFVVHYSKLIKRKELLTQIFTENSIDVVWITEEYADLLQWEPHQKKKILGISEKKLGMDLGINSRSLVVNRKRARIQGLILYCRSFFSKNNSYTTGSLPPKKTLPKAWLEVQRMHLTALRKGVNSKNDWILILEDDAIPSKDAFLKIQKIIQTVRPQNKWISLNAGAGLTRTSSDPKPDSNDLFRVRPAATRCAVSYLVSNDLATKIMFELDRLGLPDWLPIDLVYQALLRKTRAHAFWQEPPVFEQGSESGQYPSKFELIRNPSKARK